MHYGSDLSKICLDREVLARVTGLIGTVQILNLRHLL